MQDFILVIDTETSGIPKDFKEPTSNTTKWPYILQIAWSVFKKNGELVVSRDYYIDAGNVDINKNSLAIHGITNEVTRERGIPRAKVLKLLSDDLIEYEPLIVGHFIEFDKKMVEVGFSRVGFQNSFKALPRFCTMQYSSKIAPHFGRNTLRLDELYRYLFDEEIENYHNAKFDVDATSKIFFELLKRGDIDDKEVLLQSQTREPKRWKLFTKN